jgi:hypothetical protein
VREDPLSGEDGAARSRARPVPNDGLP